MKLRLSLIRFLLEAAFLVLIAAAAGLAGLDTIWIAVTMFGAWLLVALVERSGSKRVPASPEPEPEPEPQAVAEPEAEVEPDPEAESEPAPEPESKRRRFLAAAPPQPPEPEPEPEPVVVSLALHDSTPRTWNLWQLESLAEAMNGDSRAEERTLLLLHMREFSDAAGNLPLEFDQLVRDAFGAELAGILT
ncbi:MAG: hypothetical protein QOG06_1919 [Gaiellaceae bacterium]|nr:hypothetical protein [Gaiellaceae bacterium]